MYINTLILRYLYFYYNGGARWWLLKDSDHQYAGSFTFFAHFMIKSASITK